MGGCEGEEEGGSKLLVILALDIEFSWLWPNICNPGIRMLWSDAKGSERGGEGRKPDLQGLKIEAVRGLSRWRWWASTPLSSGGQMTTDQNYSIERRVVKEVPAAEF